MGNIAKKVDPNQTRMVLYQCEWIVEDTMEFQELWIRERAIIKPPEDKELTLIVNGVICDLKPGRYFGEVVLRVSDYYVTPPTGLMYYNQILCTLTPALCVENGRVSHEKSVIEGVWGGNVSDTEANGVYIGSSAECSNGIVIDNSVYSIKNSRFDMEGFGCNDYIGVGSAISIYGDSKVAIENCDFNFSGNFRCILHAGGNSRVRVSDCDITNIGLDLTDWLGREFWNIALRGSNRLTQLSDYCEIEYIGCRMKSNGWGIFSLDGVIETKLTAKDCKITLTGPKSHGYGVFCIATNDVVLDNCVVDVYGFPIFLMGMEGKGRWSVLNGSMIKGRRYGIMCTNDDHSILTLKDSTFATERATMVIKSSATRIDIDNCVISAGDGIFVQMMDTEEYGMDMVKYLVPIGEKDMRIEDRDLTKATEDDVIINMSNMTVEGNIFNSVTNIHAERHSKAAGMGRNHDTVVGLVEYATPGEDEIDLELLRSPKNLGINMKNARIKGIVSSAVQEYPEGVTEITPENWLDISNVTQTAALTVNNGVILSLDGDSIWTITGTSYISALTLAPGARVETVDGRTLKMTVNAKETPVAPGTYTGDIVIQIA